MRRLFLSILFTFHLAFVAAQSNFVPGGVPLAVRSPYLNVWQNSQNWGGWPQAFNFQHIEAWLGLVKVDDTTYEWMGGYGGPNATTVQSTTITPTRTIIVFNAGPVQLNVTFLSPIEPSDWVKQSIPFSYMYIQARSTDSSSHSVKLYTDISGEWASGDAANVIQWDTTETNDAYYHSFRRSVPAFMTENTDISEDSNIYFATRKRSSLTWQTGADSDLRGGFVTSGGLANSKDTKFRAISDSWPVFAFALDIGTVTGSWTTEPFVCAVGQMHDPALRYADSADSIEIRVPLFQSKYDNDMTSLINDFLNDFSDAQKRAVALDQKITSAAASVSSNYTDLVSIAARQTLAATELTISKGSDGNWNQSDVKMFMRDMGNGRRVNPVEVMYAAYPMLLYLNSSMAGLLLDPLLQYQSTSAYKNEYAALDLGQYYPNATGNADTHSQRVEQSANMLIMALAHASFSGDGTLIFKYYSLLKKWADYLVGHALTPTGEMTADNLSTANMTNLAVKGIIGIKAMSEISSALSMPDDKQQYSDTATNYIGQWQNLASSSNHLTAVYGDSQSSGLMYNLYADKLLQTNLIPQDVYKNQASYYTSQASSAPAFGLPFDQAASSLVAPHWTLFTAASVSDSSAATTLINMVHKRAANASLVTPFPSSYKSDTGGVNGGSASASGGAMFALLALSLTKQTIVVPSNVVSSPSSGDSIPSNSGSKSNAGAIAGGVVGGLAALGIVAFAIFFVLRKRRKQESDRVSLDASYNAPSTYHPEFAPVRQFKNSNPSFSPTADLPSAPLGAGVVGAGAGVDWQRDGWRHDATGQQVMSPSSELSAGESFGYAGLAARQRQSSVTKRAPSSDFTSSHTQEARGARSDTTLQNDVAHQLRNEVDNLRREMHQIRAERAYGDEPPPSYPA